MFVHRQTRVSFALLLCVRRFSRLQRFIMHVNRLFVMFMLLRWRPLANGGYLQVSLLSGWCPVDTVVLDEKWSRKQLQRVRENFLRRCLLLSEADQENSRSLEVARIPGSEGSSWVIGYALDGQSIVA